MTTPRLASLVPAVALAAVFAGVGLTPSVAMADDHNRVESIAAKGTISPVVPVEWGLGLGFAAAILGLAMERRARR